MIYALIAGTVHHAMHMQEFLAMLAAAHWEEVDPLYHARVMLFGEGAVADSLEKRLRWQKATPRQIHEASELQLELQQWQPQLLIFSNWDKHLADTLINSQERLLRFGTAVMALGPEGDDEAMTALDAGVNVYVGAPVSEALVLAQASALLRHGHAWEQVRIDVPGILRIDPETRRVHVLEQELRLTKRIFRLFHYMAQQSERTFSAMEIAQHLAMGKRHIQQNTVAAQIHRLRKNLEEVGASSWLQTVHGFGYRLSIPRQK
ncbi:winged helix-turn-helix domain-containing protein [Acidithiobacillus sp. IBUN Pt1247-S3]|uniref:winged helix family transcriptional regulator n=1 Tax=Acidithiobacillus sp. IBUN Pt1247-S3 TaxID=3166642 RepID=UPI0034E468BE